MISDSWQEWIRRIRVGLIGLGLLLVPLLLDPFAAHTSLDPKWTALVVLAALLALLHGAGLLLGERIPPIRWYLFGAVAAVMGLLLAHVLVVPRNGYTLDAALRFWPAFFIALSAGLTVRRAGEVTIFVTAVGLSALLISVYGLLQWLDLDIFARWFGLAWQHQFGTEPEHFLTSTLGNAHYVGIHLCICLFILLALPWTDPRHRKAHGIIAAIFLLSFVVMVLTRNRSAFLGIGAALFFLWLTRHQRRIPRLSDLKRWWALSFASLVLFFVGLAYVYPRFKAMLLFRDSSANSRLLLWQITGEMWRERPWFGIGLDQFRVEFIPRFLDLMGQDRFVGYQRIADSLEALRSNFSHNEYVQFLAEFGVAGFAVWCFLFAAPLAAGGLERRGSAGLRRRVLGAAAAATLATALFSFPLHLPSTLLLYCVMVGCLMARWDESKSPKDAFRSSNGVGWFLRLPLALVLLAAGTLGLGYAAWIYPTYWKAGEASREVLSQVANPREVLALTEEVLGKRPYDGEVLLVHGIALAMTGGFNEAVRTFDEAEEYFSSHTVYFYRGQAYYFADQLARAKREFEKMLELDPDFPETHYWLAQIAYRRRYYDRAIGLLRRELRENPSHADSQALLAECLFLRGDESAAETAFLAAINMAPASPALYVRLGDLYLEQGDLYHALVQYEEAIRRARVLDDFPLLREIEAKVAEAQRQRSAILGL